MNKKITSAMMALALGMSLGTQAQQVAEELNRAPVAVKTSQGVFISWRSLNTDGDALGFNILRNGEKINTEPITTKTNFLDANGAAGDTYTLEGVMAYAVVETSETKAWSNIYTTIQLDRPEGGVIKSWRPYDSSTKKYGSAIEMPYTYSPNDMSVGDVDGDGDYELVVKWDPSTSQDNSISSGYSGNTIFDCYEMDGTKKWRIDMGVNIRAGAHYSPFLVYDFDGDGKAEFVLKTAPGTKDGAGNYVSAAGASDDIKNITSNESDCRNSEGHIVKGEEFLTIFNGETGVAMQTVWFNPNRSTGVGNSNMTYGNWEKVISKSTNYNRGERYNACVAYLDGEAQLPSIIMQRGYYTYAYFWAIDWDGKDLKTRWLHRGTSASAWDVVDASGKTIASGSGKSSFGQGVHGISVGDVNGDGFDEIVMGAATIAHDGKLLCSTGLGHGDAIHLTDLIPDRPGLEVMTPHEEKPYGYDVHDATTGERLVYATSSADNGRGLAGFFIPGNSTAQFWSSADGNTYDCSDGSVLASSKGDTNFRIYWNGDLYDDTFDGRFSSSTNSCSPRIQSWNGSGMSSIFEFSSYNKPQTCNSTKATPCLQADLLGDWREELIMWSLDDPSKVMIYTTPTPTEYKVTCLMQDHIYRMGVAWQNSSYNQPPHLGYSLSDEFDTAPSVMIQSGAATQSVILGKDIEPIVISWRKCDGVNVPELPAGLTYKLENNMLTISGRPVEAGDIKFTITSKGNYDTEAKDAELNINIVVKQPDTLDLIAAYHFNETLANDIEGEAVAKQYTPAYVNGVYGKAIDLTKAESANGRLQQAHYDNLALSTQNFTISMWFAAAKTSSDGQYIFHKGSVAKNTSTGASGCWIGLENKGNKLTFSIDDDVVKTSAALDDASKYFDGQWHQVVCVRNAVGKKLLLYIDGEMVASATDATGNIAQTENLVIGNCTVSFNNRFAGLMDELLIYTGAMEADQVAKEFAEGKESLANNVDASATPSIHAAETCGKSYNLAGMEVDANAKGLVICEQSLKLNK